MSGILTNDIYDWFFLALMYEKDAKKGLSLFDIFKYQTHSNNWKFSRDEPGNYEEFKCSVINLRALNMIYEREGKIYFSELFNNWEALMINHKQEQAEYYGKIQEKIYAYHRKNNSINIKNGIIEISEKTYNTAISAYCIQEDIEIN